MERKPESEKAKIKPERAKISMKGQNCNHERAKVRLIGQKND
jgi:hypothetical protein